MHPREIPAGDIDEGIVAGEHDVLRMHAAVFRNNTPVLHIEDGCLLIDGQVLRHGPDKHQRVELCLMREAHRTRGRERQRRLAHIERRKPQFLCGLRFGAEHGGVSAIEIGVAVLEIAVDPLRRNQITIRPYCGLVCHGILPRPLRAERPRERLIDHAVLCGELRGSPAGLTARDAVPLQHDDLVPRLAQRAGDQNAGHAGADHCDLAAHVAAQALPRLDLTGH